MLFWSEKVIFDYSKQKTYLIIQEKVHNGFSYTSCCNVQCMNCVLLSLRDRLCCEFWVLALISDNLGAPFTIRAAGAGIIVDDLHPFITSWCCTHDSGALHLAAHTATRCTHVIVGHTFSLLVCNVILLTLTVHCWRQENKDQEWHCCEYQHGGECCYTHETQDQNTHLNMLYIMWWTLYSFPQAVNQSN